MENIVAKGEIARYVQFLLLSLCFQKAVYCRGVRKCLYKGKGWFVDLSLFVLLNPSGSSFVQNETIYFEYQYVMGIVGFRRKALIDNSINTEPLSVRLHLFVTLEVFRNCSKILIPCIIYKVGLSEIKIFILNIYKSILIGCKQGAEAEIRKGEKKTMTIFYLP